MKLALILPGYIESPDYRHLVVIDNKLKGLGFTTVRVDACNLWQTNNGSNYSTTGYIKQVEDIISSYSSEDLTEVVLIGHSLGTLVAAYIASTNNKVTKIVCLSPPIALDRSDFKWVNGVRTSKKDLPYNKNSFREFSVPISFVEDRKQYSLLNSLKDLTRPILIITGENDPSVEEVRDTVKSLKIKKYIEIKGMGHDFRQSEELCRLVADEISKFLGK